MRIKEVVRKVLEAIKEVSAKNETGIKDKNNLLYFESQLAYGELKQLFLKHSKSNAEANPQSIKPFCEFLAKRWQRIKDTDAIYCHTYQSHINKICIRLAAILAGIQGVSDYELLMPTLRLVEPYDGNLNRVIMSDDNKTIIDVFKCLETAHANGDAKLRHTHPLAKGPTTLTDAETNRITRYSARADRYYKDILDKKTGHLDKAKNNLRKVMGEDVFSTYGEQGWILLEKNIFDRVQNREQLVEIMSKLKRTDWEKFLEHIKPEKLMQIVLEGKSVVTACQDNKIYNGDEEHDRVVMFLILDNYRKGLKAQTKDYTGFFGSWTGYSRDQKLDASLIPYNYLRSNDKDATFANFGEYLKKEEFKAHIGPLTAAWDRLGKITKQMLLLGSPDFVKELQSQYKKDQELQKHLEKKQKQPKYQMGFA